MPCSLFINPHCRRFIEFSHGNKNSESGQFHTGLIIISYTHVITCTCICFFFSGVNSFKTFMAYKDVMMLNDEEVSLHLHACIYVKDFMCSSACVLHVHVPLLYWAPLFQWTPLLDMGVIYYSWQCCIPSSNLYIIIIIWQCTGLMPNNPFNLEYSGGMISFYRSFTGSLPVRLL